MSRALSLFQGYGIEIEYMIVDRERLDILPIADKVIQSVAGSYVNEVSRGDIAWSNELVLHVIELKTNGPSTDLDRLAGRFQASVEEVDRILAASGGRLMPTAMHPWMDPHRETRLWPHEYNPIYEAYNRIFDCRGHGWSNLQSMHVNLPFDGDAEFVRLHAAIRGILPILPMLAASSPVAAGRIQGALDARMREYRTNSRRIPSITGQVVPEPITSIADYHRCILEPMYRDISPFDSAGILREEWLNSRGAIARFDRNAIEIRVLDTQECPRADIAVAAAVASLLRDIVFENHGALDRLQAIATERLAGILSDGIRSGEAALIEDQEYLSALGLGRAGPLTGGALWSRLLDRSPPVGRSLQDPLQHVLRNGTLASRILRAAGPEPSRTRLFAVYQQLCDCLSQDALFAPA